MTRFLIRSFDDPNGYVERDYPDGALPRSREESYVPWGLTADQRVVYARTGEHTGWRGGGGLRPYDSQVSQMRRRLCQSELGLIALNIFGGRKGPRLDESLEKSIAVLIFDNLIGDAGQDYMCVGLR